MQEDVYEGSRESGRHVFVCIGSVWGRHSFSIQQIFVSVGFSSVQARC